MTCLLCFAPAEILSFLTAWLVISIPVGILIGHCALGEV
jgi:hypothetical protein